MPSKLLFIEKHISKRPKFREECNIFEFDDFIDDFVDVVLFRKVIVED